MHMFRTFVAALLLGAAFASSALADDTGDVAGHFQLRLRGIAILPDTSGKVKAGGIDIGGSTHVTKNFVPEVDGTYFLTDHLGLELIAGAARSSVSHSIAGHVADASFLPPTLTLQYHFMPDSNTFRPYVGAGVNYTMFFDVKGAYPDTKFSDNFGWVLQAGVDVPVGDGPYFLNADVKKIFLSTDMTALGGYIRAHTKLDPWVIGAGAGIRF